MRILALAAVAAVLLLGTLPGAEANTVAQKNQQPHSRLKTVPVETSNTLPLQLAISLVINAGIYGLYASWRGSKPENSRRFHSRPRSGHVAKPLVLRQTDGIDPATMREGTEIKPLGHADGRGLDEGGGLSPGNDAADPDIATLALDPMPGGGESAFMVKNAGSSVRTQGSPKTATMQKTGFRFPGQLGDAFEPIPGERILGEYNFAVPLNCEGIVAITNYRVISIRRSWNWSVLPPRVHIESKRHRVKLGTIEATEDHHVQRPIFLLLAAGFSWWIPLGLIPAGIALGAFFLLPREEIAIRFDGEAMRSWPLPKTTAERFRHQAEDAVLQFRAAVADRKRNRPTG